MRYAYIDKTTGSVNSFLSGSPNDRFPDPATNEDQVETDYVGALPAYWDGSTVQAVPTSPGADYVWSWAPSFTWSSDLSTAKANAWTRVKAARDASEFGSFVWSGHTFDGDTNAQRRIQLAVMGAQIAITGNTAWSIDWTLADNSVLTLSAADMLAVAEAKGAQINQAHELARSKREAIDAATTLAELEAI